MRLEDVKKIARLLAPHASVQINDARTLRELTVVARYVGARTHLAPVNELEPEPAPISCNVWLMSVGANKIGVIKAVRQLTELGLMDAKDVCDRTETGGAQLVLRDVTPARARLAKELLQAVGATVRVE